MKKIIFASSHQGAGKTSLIVSIASLVKQKCGYIKPFGDRLIYRRKINWDYDTHLINGLWNLGAESEEMTLGFNHTKIRFMYDSQAIKDELIKMADLAGKDKDILFIEGGKTINYGSSVSMDAFSQAKMLDAKFILVVDGDNETILDEIHFIKNYLDIKNFNVSGLILNKVSDIDDFEHTYSQQIKSMGFHIYGLIPFKEQLTHFTVKFLADRFFAKVIAGEKGLDKIIKNIFVGAMSTDESLRNPLFNKENKLLITSGDRSDMVLSALESDTSGIILTDNLLPPSAIIAKASEKNVPLLLVTSDTYQIARQMDEIEALLTGENDEKIGLLCQLVAKYINIKELLA